MTRASIILIAALALASPLALRAQSRRRLRPARPGSATGHTVDDIIKAFGAKESEFQHARDDYTFRQSVKVDTLDDDTNKVDGEYQQITDIVFTPDGKREEHVVFAPRTLSSAS